MPSGRIRSNAAIGLGIGAIALVAGCAVSLPVQLPFFAPQQQPAQGQGQAPAQGQVPAKPQAKPGGGSVVSGARAVTGTISAVYGYAGSVQASQQVNVVPRASGVVQDILVDVGSVVRKGDILATLDQGALPAQLLQAQAALLSAQTKLAQVEAGARPEDVAAARAQVDQARARLSGLRAGRPEDVDGAQAAWDSANAKLALLQKGPTPDTLQAAQSAVDSDKAAIAAAEAALANLSGTSAADLQGAVSQVETVKAQIAAAEAALQGVQATYDAAVSQKASAQTALAQADRPIEAQLALARATVAVAESTLEAAKSSQTTVTAGLGTTSPCGSSGSGETCNAATQAAQFSVAAGEKGLVSARAQLDLLQTGGAPAAHAALVATIAQADASIRTAETTRANLQSTLVAARENLKVAQAKLDALQNGTIQSQRLSTQSTLLAAREKLKTDQAKVEQLENTPQEEEVAQAQATVDQAQQQLLKAQTPGSVSDQDQQRQVIAQMQAQLQLKANPYTDTDVQAAAAAVAQAEGQVALAQINLDQTTLMAPFDGVIWQRLMTPGAFASSQTPILTLISPSVEIHLTVEEARIGQVRAGQVVNLSVPAYPGQAFAARVAGVAPAGDARAHTFDVKVVPNQQDERLKPGMYAQVQLTALESHDAVLVPREAVVQQEEGAVVFVVENDRAVARKVELGLTDAKNIQIMSGVALGDLVITVGQNALRDGATVAVVGGAEGGAATRPAGQRAGAPGQQGQGSAGGAGTPAPAR